MAIGKHKHKIMEYVKSIEWSSEPGQTQYKHSKKNFSVQINISKQPKYDAE